MEEEKHPSGAMPLFTVDTKCTGKLEYASKSHIQYSYPSIHILLRKLIPVHLKTACLSNSELAHMNCTWESTTVN